jgi:hypothetical protein
MKYLFPILFLFFLSSCSSDEDETSTEDAEVENVETPQIKNIETLFDTDEFDDPKKVDLLKELKVCSDKNKGIDDYMNPSCSPRFFNILPFIDNVSIENAFLIQIKSKTNGFPLRRLLVFVRERGVLVKVNGFVANLIGTKKSSTSHDDLLLRFNDKDQGQDVFYNCLFTWEKTAYKYKSVEVIEGPNWGGPVKAELKDSISKEVEKDILENKMIF